MNRKGTQFRFIFSLILAFVGILLVNHFNQLNNTDIPRNIQEPILVIPNLPFPILLLFGLGFGVIGWIITSQQFSQKFVGEATAESLGAIRIITCTTVFIMCLWLEDVPTSALLPQEMRQPMGIIDLFYNIPGFETFVGNQTSLQIFEWLTALVLFLGIIGWQTRIVVPLGAFCYLILGGIVRHKIKFFHFGLTATYVLILVAFTPCGDGLSVDRLWKVYKGESVPKSDRPSQIYGWSRYFCWTAVGLAYLFAGLSKIRDGGLFWFDATNMRAILYQCALDPMGFNFHVALRLIDAPDIIFMIMGFMGSYAEIAFISVLFSRLARKIMPILIMSMHIGIMIFQNIFFFDSICIQLIFFDFTSIRQSMEKWLRSKSGIIHYLYNQKNPIQYRIVQLLECLDIFKRIKFVDFNQINLKDDSHKYQLNSYLTDINAQNEQIFIVSNDQINQGFKGFCVISQVIPLFWFFRPLMLIPKIPSLGISVYQYIIRNGFKDIQENNNLDSSEKTEIMSASTVYVRSFKYSLMVSILATLMLFSWFYRVQFYPFTAWQMFAYINTSGIVKYSKVLATYESGVTESINLERVIPALFSTRARTIVKECFSKDIEKVRICDKFLDAAGSVYNSKPQNTEKITQFDIQEWQWNFFSDPHDPNYGKIIKNHIFEIDNIAHIKNHN